MKSVPTVDLVENIPTVLGNFKAEWSQGSLVQLTMSPTHPDSISRSPSQFATSLQEHLRGIPQDFSEVKLYTEHLTEFSRSVYSELRSVPPGSVTSYGQLAERLGKPGASRAVGTALGKNPFLLVVPCHRVLAQNGRLGGFSAPGGQETKEIMLAAEGFGTESLWDDGEMEKGHQHLLSCSKLGPIIQQVGPCPLQPLYPDSPFGALARCIIYQQLATSAARAIESRVKTLGSPPFPSAVEIQNLADSVLRDAGLSASKAETLKRLSNASLQGELKPEELKWLPNSVVEKQVSTLKGLGPWSARIFLLFHLGRRDIFPVKDLGIRKACQSLFSRKELPKPDYMERQAKAWKPYRSLASWYLWRSLEL